MQIRETWQKFGWECAIDFLHPERGGSAVFFKGWQELRVGKGENKQGIISSAWFRSKAISSHWETIGRLREVILMLKKIV